MQDFLSGFVVFELSEHFVVYKINCFNIWCVLSCLCHLVWYVYIKCFK